MSDQLILEQDFAGGIVSDSPRHRIVYGGVYDIRDYLLDLPAVARKRGGSAFQSSEIGDGNIILVAVAAPEFPGDPRVVVVASAGADKTLYDVTTDTAASGVALSTTQPTENPSFYVDRLILCDGTGDGAGSYEPVKKAYLDSGTVAVDVLGGGPPNCRYSCVHLGMLVLANGIVTEDMAVVEHKNRVWFAPTGLNTDIEDTWDIANAYENVPEAITGLASVNGVLLVFTRNATWRILGNNPPGSVGPSGPNDNMQVQPLGAVGCIDARSIVQKDGAVYFANESGVYYTNGAGYQSITQKPDGQGIQQLWADAVSGFSPILGSVVCGGVWLNDNLFFTIRHADEDPQEGARYQFLYHGATGAWTTLSDGVTADMYATRFAPNGEIYAACGDAGDPVRLLKLSGLFKPTVDNMTDANGDTVEPTLTTRAFSLPAYGRRFIRLGSMPGLKAWGHAWLEFLMDAPDGTTIAVSK